MRHHTLVHKVDLKFTKQAKAIRESERVPEVENDLAPVQFWKAKTPHHVWLWSHRRGIANQRTQGFVTGGPAFVAVLPIFVFREKGKQQVMALRDSGCELELYATDANPADDITRELSPTELGLGFRYNNIPNLLYKSAEFWPENRVKASCEKDDVSEKR